MRLDLISPPRLDLLEAGVGRSAASWGITTGPKLRACLSNQHRLCCARSVLNLLSRWSSSRPWRRGLANTAVGQRFKRIMQSSLLPHSEGSLCCPVSRGWHLSSGHLASGEQRHRIGGAREQQQIAD
jgi:hypothetical protein